MTRRYSLPFKTAVGTEVVLEPWHYSTGGDNWLRVDDGVPGWDYLSQLSFHREATIDAGAIRRVCEVDEQVPLALVVTAHCPTARFRRVLFRREISGDTHGIAVRVEVPSSQVADHIRLETEILVTQEPARPARFTAKYAGSRLFNETVPVHIEGTRSRMPLQIARFEQQLAWLRAPHAPWHVDCGNGDLHMPMMHDLRVYLNSDRPEFLEAANHGNAAVISLLKSDIARRILENALADETFLSGSADFAEGTMGEVAMGVLRMCFEDMPPRDVRALSHSSAAKFEAMIRSRFCTSHG